MQELLLSGGFWFWLVGGTIFGVLVGAVPGLTATLAISLLLPLTFHLSATHAIVMMTGIFTGAMHGGSISAITLGIPGSPSAVMTVMDGHAMSRRGDTEAALGLATFSSVVGGTVAGIALVLFAPQLANVALHFQSPEMFSLVLLALVAVGAASGASLLKAGVAAVLGLMLATIGIDPLTPVPRFTLGAVNLLAGVPLLPVVIGLFAVAEVMNQVARTDTEDTPLPGTRIRFDRLFAFWPLARGAGVKVFLKSSGIGTVVGALPGAGAAMAAFLSYSEAKRASPYPERFGTGIPEGIIAPQAADNAMTGGALIPMMALGIPGDAVTAVILGGLLIQGIIPGPQLFTTGSSLVQALFLGYFASYVVILAVGFLLLPLYAKIATVDRGILFPTIAALAIVASFVAERTVFAMYLTVAVGVLAYVMQRHDYPVIPLLMGLILGPMLEANLRRSLIISHGNPAIFVTSPVSLGLLLVAALFIVYFALGRRRARGPEILERDEVPTAAGGGT